MNSIVHLLSNPFLKRSRKERLEIKQLGRPTPLLNLTSTQNPELTTSIRLLNLELYTNHNWIAGCETKDAFFCFPCVLYKNSNSQWATIGYRNLKNLSDCIDKHETDPIHINNVINYTLLGKKSTNELKKAIERHNVEVERNLQVLDLLISTIKFCGQGYIPIIKRTYDKDDDDYDTMDNDAFQELVQLISGFNSTLKNYLKMDIFKNDNIESMKTDIVNSAFEVYQAEVLKEVSKAEFLSIIIEDLDDCDDDYRKLFILRYVVDGNPVERVWKLLKYVRVDVFYATLQKELKLIVKDAPKLIAQSYQELNIKIPGAFNAIDSKIQKIYPNAKLVHFYRHGLYDIIINTTDYDMQVRLTFCRIWGICDFFTEESCSKKLVDLFENIVNQKQNHRKIWNFVDDRINTVGNYRKELLETMDKIQENALNYPYAIISKAYSLALDLQDDDFVFWVEMLRVVVPQIEYYLIEYENCLKPLDSNFNFVTRESINSILTGDSNAPVSSVNPPEVEVKIEADIEIFQSNIEGLQMDFESAKSEVKLEEEPSSSCVSNISKKRKLIDSEKPPEVEFINCTMWQLQKRLKFRGHTFASRLLNPKNFQQYTTNFPESFLVQVSNSFPILNLPRLRSELIVLYQRVHYRTLDGCCSLLKEMSESKLDTTFHQTIKLLNIVLTIPTKTDEPGRCFSTRSKVQFYLKNCKDHEFIHFLLPLACEKEFIDNVFEFNRKVVQIFTEKPGRIEHFKRKTLPEGN